jgi:D-beta-D-heptose 7-phosphate kinase/D-beta-D-heptose 1-phosphate adenosyltransferase
MNFEGVRILVVGDVMLDHYISGHVKRISPEAPVPILSVEKHWSVPGGAANVARNLVCLGVQTQLLSLIGQDATGHELDAAVREEGINSFLLAGPRPTTRKTRILARGQQLLRQDEEQILPPRQEEMQILLRQIAELLPEQDVVILSDYDKGVLHPCADGSNLCQHVIREARRLGIPVLADPKGASWERYAGVQCITPNSAEFAVVCGRDPHLPIPREERATLAAKLRSSYALERILLTRGPRGMVLFGDGAPYYCRAVTREVADVSGAGDTVIAILAACLGRGLAWKDSARVANMAAGIAVGKLGTASVSLGELNWALRQDGDNPKLYTLAEVLDKVADWRRKKESIVFTNGCFDLLHPGHVSLLRQSVAQGDHLIVGLNSDASVRRLKGPQRPIQNEYSRAMVLAALNGVDAIVIFDEDTPFNLIRTILPDVLVKGSDYALENVVGADLVRQHGGRVYLAQLVDGCSTTGIVHKIDRGSS